MKKFVLFTACLLFLSCNSSSDIDVGGGDKESQVEPPWLKELIQKAETDKTGNCLGTIWLVNYNGEEFYVTDMALGSGGIAYWIFDSLGNRYVTCEVDESSESAYFDASKHFISDESFASQIIDALAKSAVIVYKTPSLST